MCDGKIKPYDRRTPSPLLPLVRELRDALWATGLPIHYTGHAKLLARVDEALAGEPQEGRDT